MKKDYIKDIRKKIGKDTLVVCGASVIIHKDSKILLQKRTDSGLWATHGGCVEIGEKVEDAAKRELFEETGLIAQNLKFFKYKSGKKTLHTYPNGDKVYIINLIFTCDDYCGNLLESSDEVSKLEWFEISSLPKNLSPIDKKVLNEFQIANNRNKDLSLVIYGLEYALANGGIKKPESVIADDFMEYGKSGTVYFKSDVIETVRARKNGNTKISDFSMKLLEQNTAFVTYKGIKDGKKTLRSSIWKFNAGDWHIVFHQGTKA